jgi:glycosyltransferase involved in cell wall biosynthesis
MRRIVVIGAYYNSEITTGANKRFERIAAVLDKYSELIVIIPKGSDFKHGQRKINRISNNRILKFIQLSWYVISYRNSFMIIGDFNPIPNLLGLKNYYHLIHDLRIITNYTRQSMRVNFFKRLYLISLRLQGQFIVVSDFTKYKLIQVVSNNSIIITLPNGIGGKIFDDKARDRYQLLYVATFEHRKNHDLLIRTLSLLPEDFTLVLVGKDLGCLTKTINLISELNLQERVTLFTEELSDLELENIYCSSGIYISTSRYEGFGMPVLEALEHDMRILVTDLEPHKQILGDHHFFDIDIHPFDLAQLVKKAMKVDSKHRFKTLKLNNWDTLVKKHLLSR